MGFQWNCTLKLLLSPPVEWAELRFCCWKRSIHPIPKPREIHSKPIKKNVIFVSSKTIQNPENTLKTMGNSLRKTIQNNNKKKHFEQFRTIKKPKSEVPSNPIFSRFPENVPPSKDPAHHRQRSSSRRSAACSSSAGPQPRGGSRRPRATSTCGTRKNVQKPKEDACFTGFL